MFDLKEFIKKGLLSAVGKMADYQVILNAAGWLEKGVLTEDDLAEINNMIESQYIKQEEVIEEIPQDNLEETVPEESVVENEEMESTTPEDSEGEVDSDA